MEIIIGILVVWSILGWYFGNEKTSFTIDVVTTNNNLYYVIMSTTRKFNHGNRKLFIDTKIGTSKEEEKMYIRVQLNRLYASSNAYVSSIKSIY